jgi:ribosomal protein RSM22 (predicted rRNA methylase)
MFPDSVLQHLENRIASEGIRRVRECAEEMSHWYREADALWRRPRWSAGHYLAYAAVRMPATLGVASAVLAQLRRRLPGQVFHSHLDLCAGPGTMAWAAAGAPPAPERVTQYELDPGFIELGKQLASLGSSCGPRNAEWIQADLTSVACFEPHDLVSLCYGIGELSPGMIGALIDKAWNAARVALVIIEPGTPAGYRRILECRERLIAAGAEIAAPCPHSRTCPLAAGESWCHFAERLARSRLHRLLKDSELGYEDEKYSYVIAARSGLSAPAARIIGHPRLTKPGVVMDVCGSEGVRKICVARRDREKYHQARRAHWGDDWD